MPVRFPRTRTLSVRLSEEEYERLQAASHAHGSRSISDFVRSSALWIAANCNRELWDVISSLGKGHFDLAPMMPPAEPAGLQQLQRDMEALAQEVNRLSQMIHKQAAPGKGRRSTEERPA